MDFVECPAPAVVAVVAIVVSAPDDGNEGGSDGGGGGNGGATGRAGATGIDVGAVAKGIDPDDDGDDDDDVVRRELVVPPAMDTVPSGLVNLFAAEGVLLLPLLLLLLLLLLLSLLLMFMSEYTDSINLADRPGFNLKIAGDGKNRSNSSSHGYPGKYFSFSASMSS